VGSLISAGLYFYWSSDTKLHVEVGRFLDEDRVYLKNGDSLKCWVVKESPKEIVIETKTGTFTVSRFSCKSIDKDIYLRYIRQLM
jgi:hypothetical protein